MTSYEYWRYLEEERYRARTLMHIGAITENECATRMREIREETAWSVYELTDEQRAEIYRHGDELWDRYISRRDNS